MSRAIEGFHPRLVSAAAAGFAREVTAAATPATVARAKAFLFAASRLGAFGEGRGLDLVAKVLLQPSVIERFVLVGCEAWSPATRRTLRTNLRSLADALDPGPHVSALPRERSKLPYRQAEIAAYLALADAQPTESRRQRAAALVCLGAGAGLMGGDMKALCGTDVQRRSGGLVVVVRSGRRPRVVPVLTRYHRRLAAAAAFAAAGECFVIGGTSRSRHNVTTPLTASLAGGADLPRIDIARLRATWLCDVAQVIGLRAFMDAAGVTYSQRLGDLLVQLGPPSEEEAVAFLGAGHR